MSLVTYHVVPFQNVWWVRLDGYPNGPYPDQSNAIKAAYNMILKREGEGVTCQVKVTELSGEERIHGNDAALP